MNHLKVYADFLIISTNYLVPDSHEALFEMQTHLKVKYDKDLPLVYVKAALYKENAPKPSQLIPELLSRGYSPTFVQNLLQTSKQSVSYHKKNPSKRTYENPVFLYHIDGVLKYKKSRHVYYKPVYEKHQIHDLENE